MRPNVWIFIISKKQRNKTKSCSSSVVALLFFPRWLSELLCVFLVTFVVFWLSDSCTDKKASDAVLYLLPQPRLWSVALVKHVNITNAVAQRWLENNSAADSLNCTLLRQIYCYIYLCASIYHQIKLHLFSLAVIFLHGQKQPQFHRGSPTDINTLADDWLHRPFYSFPAQTSQRLTGSARNSRQTAFKEPNVSSRNMLRSKVTLKET